MKVQKIERINTERPEKLKVCAYCRVSSDIEEQENSLENQVDYYEKYINENPEWEYAGVYADFGISGYKESRPQFQRMLEDARQGKIDLIVTKSITRFARNTDVMLKAIRELKSMNIGVFFELQNINSLSEAGEMLMTIYAAFAQGESDTYRELALMTYKRKYESGKTMSMIHNSFGYTKDENGNTVIDREQARWVREIFKMAVDGYTLAEIARYLNQQGVKTKQGCKFTNRTIDVIIENEIYKGDFKTHKTFVNADRKEMRNTGQVASYYIENEHEPIVSRSLWEKANKAKWARFDEVRVKREQGILEDPKLLQMYCGHCGHKLTFGKNQDGTRMHWSCYLKTKLGSEFCPGVHITDTVVREWLPIKGRIYVTSDTDERGKKVWNYENDKKWHRKHVEKEIPKREYPALNTENYPYMNNLYCDLCGSKLIRFISNSKPTWICYGKYKKGKEYCPGVIIPDEKVRSLGSIDNDIYIKEERHGNKKSYSYTCEARERSGKE